jgi:hypothetical protein
MCGRRRNDVDSIIDVIFWFLDLGIPDKDS